MNYGELLCLLKVLALNAPINCESNSLKLAVSSQLHTLIIRSFFQRFISRLTSRRESQRTFLLVWFGNRIAQTDGMFNPTKNFDWPTFAQLHM